VIPLLNQAEELEKKAARLREQAKEKLPQELEKLAKKLWDDVKSWGIDPQMLANEILYASGARHRPGHFLTDETGKERYTKGPIRYAPWLAKMREDPSYDLIEHYKMSMKFAYKEDIPFFEKKIKQIEAGDRRVEKYKKEIALKQAEDQEANS